MPTLPPTVTAPIASVVLRELTGTTTPPSPAELVTGEVEDTFIVSRSTRLRIGGNEILLPRHFVMLWD